MDHLIRPNAYLALRLPSDTLKVIQVVPNTTISIGKYGSFQANHILGRPYYLTFEVLEKDEITSHSRLRVVPAFEIHGDIKEEDASTLADGDGWAFDGKDGVEYEVINQDGDVVMRTNREIVDDPGRQKLTMDEIEAMKREESGSGKDLVAKILDSHSALDQKTAFALAKYTLRKAKKYMRRFTVLPLDVPLLTSWIVNEKEPMKIMELREELLALIISWSNVHCCGAHQLQPITNSIGQVGGGRWLVVDETGGLLVAAMAEKMGILHESKNQEDQELSIGNSIKLKNRLSENDPSTQEQLTDKSHTHVQNPAMSAQTNTITLVHANAQPNLSLLSYFHFDASNPTPSHPLNAHLKTTSWLQLLSPEDDTGYTEPEFITDETLQTWKSGKRGNYYRKRRRWERIKSVVDEARGGGYDGLVVASVMNPATILNRAIPYLRGAAQVVVYSPNVEPLAELVDCYSTARRSAFLTSSVTNEVPNDDFPLNPTLLLAPAIQTARCRNWQVLPGRTHPHMTGRGGAEGYIFTASRVLPADGRIEARGNFKRRKVGGEEHKGMAGSRLKGDSMTPTTMISDINGNVSSEILE